MNTTTATLVKRLERDQANKAQAREALVAVLNALKNNEQRTTAIKHLSSSQRNRLKSYASLNNLSSIDDVFASLEESPEKIEEVANYIFTISSRQSDGEKNFHEDLNNVISSQTAIFDQNSSLAIKLPGTFLARGWKGADWKGLDFMVSSFGVTELFAHKCNNGSGGSQTLGQQELMRLVQRSSPFDANNAPEYDDEDDHRPEKVEVFFRDGLTKTYGQTVNTIVVAVIQDGVGRQRDIEEMQRMALPSIYAGNPLIVFGGTREEYFRVRPLIFITVLGWNFFNESQQEELMSYITEFSKQYPQGFHGFYGNTETPWDLLTPPTKSNSIKEA